MKKFFILCIMLLALAGCAICQAADGGDLNKQQKTAEQFINVFDAAPAPEYSVIAPLLHESLAKNLNAQTYVAFQKDVKEKMGTLKEAKFRLFERLNDGSAVIYIGTFTKQQRVLMQFVFDMKSKLLAVNLNPVQEQQKAPEKK